MIHEVWIEGYLATGMEDIPAKASLLGTVDAASFKDACDSLCSDKDWQLRNGTYDPENLTVWGCRLFDNYVDASKSFG
jgi:hypothetical protein